MSVFRVEKNKNFTVMSNYHLKDRSISLKTKGLLSVMLSLPDNWDYTETGLCTITGEGRTAIRSCLKQLEEHRYLIRNRLRDEKGRMTGTEYVIYEVPVPMSQNPTLENPTLENPTAEKPTLEKPASENQTLLNTNLLNTKQDKDTNQSINPESASEGLKMDWTMESYQELRKKMKEQTGLALFGQKRAAIERQLEEDAMTLEEYEQAAAEYDPARAEKVLSYLLDVLCGAGTADILINGNPIPREIVRERLKKTDHLLLKAVVKELNTNPSIKNPKSYAISMLYNG